jgi:hypothetical protein
MGGTQAAGIVSLSRGFDLVRKSAGIRGVTLHAAHTLQLSAAAIARNHLQKIRSSELLPRRGEAQASMVPRMSARNWLGSR